MREPCSPGSPRWFFAYRGEKRLDGVKGDEPEEMREKNTERAALAVAQNKPEVGPQFRFFLEIRFVLLRFRMKAKSIIPARTTRQDPIQNG